MKRNETVARLDRRASAIGINVVNLGGNLREFRGFGRVYRMKPGGKGVVLVSAYVPTGVVTREGPILKLDSEVVMTSERVEDLFIKIQEGES